MDQFQVRDGSRLLTFKGVLLAGVSSRKFDAPRWTEMAVYKTEGGSYVLEKVGRSVVCHISGCDAAHSNLPRFQAAHPGEDPEIGYEFHDCVPDIYDFTALLVEEDRYWAMIATEPSAVIDALYWKRHGKQTLPRVAIDLIQYLSSADGDKWGVEYIA